MGDHKCLAIEANVVKVWKAVSWFDRTKLDNEVTIQFLHPLLEAVSSNFKSLLKSLKGLYSILNSNLWDANISLLEIKDTERITYGWIVFPGN